MLGPYAIAQELRDGRLQASRLLEPDLSRLVTLAFPVGKDVCRLAVCRLHDCRLVLSAHAASPALCDAVAAVSEWAVRVWVILLLI